MQMAGCLAVRHGAMGTSGRGILFGLEGWPATGMWCSVAGLLAAWGIPQDWPSVSGAPCRWETLEKSIAWAAAETMDWVYLTAL